MKIATIDIGSNTVILLISEYNEAENKLTTILNRYEIPRLSKGLVEGGEILESQLSKFYSILANYKLLIEKEKCSTVILYATNALRFASNSNEIIEFVNNQFGLNIEIIPGETEARLSYLGAISGFNNSEKYLVIDIGGGSTEIIMGSAADIEFKKSFKVGVVSLTEKFISKFPISKNDSFEIEKYLNNYFSELKGFYDHNLALVAVSGTPTTLSAIKNGLNNYDEQIIEGSKLNLEILDELKVNFSKKTPKELLSEYSGLLNGREDVIYAGTAILESIVKQVGGNIFYVSGRGLRYGMAIDYLRINKIADVNKPLIIV